MSPRPPKAENLDFNRGPEIPPSSAEKKVSNLLETGLLAHKVILLNKGRRRRHLVPTYLLSPSLSQKGERDFSTWPRYDLFCLFDVKQKGFFPGRDANLLKSYPFFSKGSGKNPVRELLNFLPEAPHNSLQDLIKCKDIPCWNVLARPKHDNCDVNYQTGCFIIFSAC